jgi:acid stress chaperone HdeB
LPKVILGVKFTDRIEVVTSQPQARCRLTPARSGDNSQEKVMLKFVGVVSALIFALDAVPAARAQVTLDVSKITCDQFAGYKITNPENIAIWLSGYYNGKRGNTILDTQKLFANTKKLERYCIDNPQTLVMNAVEAVVGVDK